MLTVNLTVQRNPNGHQELCKALCTSPIFWVSSFRISPLASILPNFMPPPITNQEQKNTTTQKQKHATQLELQKKISFGGIPNIRNLLWNPVGLDLALHQSLPDLDLARPH